MKAWLPEIVSAGQEKLRHKIPGRTFNYHVAETARVQIKGEHSGEVFVSFHITKQV